MIQIKQGWIVLLPTIHSSEIYKEDDGSLHQDYVLQSYGGVEHFHLYLISNEEIKKDDWFVHLTLANKSLNKCDGISNNKFAVVGNGVEYMKMFCKKIIATTDISLTNELSIKNVGGPYETVSIILPNISKDFIGKYIKEYKVGDVITPVLIEYESNALKINHEDISVNIKLI